MRPALDPPRTLRVVVDAVVVGVMSGVSFECPSLLDRLLVCLQEGCVAAGTIVVLNSKQKQRCRIRRGIHVREGLPVDRWVAGRLRKLMHDLPVRPLPRNQELQLRARKRKVAEAVHGVERIKRVAPKEPPKAGPCAVGGLVVPRD